MAIYMKHTEKEPIDKGILKKYRSNAAGKEAGSHVPFMEL